MSIVMKIFSAIGFLSLIMTTLSLGKEPGGDVRIVSPLQADSTSYDQGRLFLVSVAKDAGPNLVLSTQWISMRLIDVSTKMAKDNFPREFYKLLGPNTTIQLLTYSFKQFRGFTKPESLAFAYSDSMSVRALWQRPVFAALIRTVQSTDAGEVLVSLKGWKDSTYTPVYDDPGSDDRSLYKLHVQLIPGVNRIYMMTGRRQEGAVEYVMNYVNEEKSIDFRPNRFHNSKLEESCNSCHEGLPSADSGKTMKADCGICHKTFGGALYLHAPVEMKECSSCHTWSTEKKSIVLVKDVPELCLTCHKEKRTLIDSAFTQHPVAGDCLTCHSPHATDQKHLLHGQVYSLCTGCHEDQTMNHPVGRHPLRFIKLNDGEELSCASCHNPHGSEHDRLLRSPGGRMGMCMQCH